MIRALLELFRATVELGYRNLLALPCKLGADHVRGRFSFCDRCGAYLEDENDPELELVRRTLRKKETNR